MVSRASSGAHSAPLRRRVRFPHTRTPASSAAAVRLSKKKLRRNLYKFFLPHFFFSSLTLSCPPYLFSPQATPSRSRSSTLRSRRAPRRRAPALSSTSSWCLPRAKSPGRQARARASAAEERNRGRNGGLSPTLHPPASSLSLPCAAVRMPTHNRLVLVSPIVGPSSFPLFSWKKKTLKNDTSSTRVNVQLLLLWRDMEMRGWRTGGGSVGRGMRWAEER